MVTVMAVPALISVASAAGMSRGRQDDQPFQESVPWGPDPGTVMGTAVHFAGHFAPSLTIAGLQTRAVDTT